MRLIRGAIALFLLAGLTACAERDDGSPPEKNVDADRAACRLLNAADRARVDGTNIDEVMPVEAGVPRENQCGWASHSANIRVASMSASAWATTLPRALDELQNSGKVELSSADRAQIAEARK